MKPYKIMKLLFCLLLINSCNMKEKNNDKNYFDFDDLEYYYKNISEKDVLLEYEKSRTEKYDGKYLEIIEKDYPENLNLNETTLSNELIKFGYLKYEIEKSKFKEINTIFSNKPCDELTTSGCIPIYNDIFLFKKNEKIVGIAKVCFRCRNAYILGSNQNWDYFGECGDYEKLQEILNSYTNNLPR